jgi:nucleoside-diphosphate-sugar epimerase
VEKKCGRNLKVIQADALNQDQLLKATQGSEIIFGAFNASQYTDKSWEAEFPLFIQNFVECGKSSNAKLIFMDNVYSYQNQESKKAYDENTPIIPYNKKGEIRQLVANIFLDGLKEYNLQGNIIKSSDLYGPYALNSMIGDRYFKRLFLKHIAEILPFGNNLHSLTYTRDVGRIAVRVATNVNQPTVVHTPNAPAKGYQDMVRMTYDYFDQMPKESLTPAFIFNFLGLFVPPIKSVMGMMYQWNNDFVIESLYNQDFVPTNLEDGMKETVSWFKANLSQ